MNEKSGSPVQALTLAGRKVTALSFILLIVIANFWLIKRFTGEPVASWSQDLFYLGVCGAGVGFLLMVPGWLYPPEISHNSGDNSENGKNDH